jgi:2-C-methyl-D-erythritol 4-phosphate cytidylyltransferase
MKTVAIISAAGSGKRMGRPKQFLEIDGQPMIERTLAVFEACGVIDDIVLVVNADEVERAKKLKSKKIRSVVAGGQERYDSVHNGLKALDKDVSIVVIHDGARPFVTPGIIEKSVAEAQKCGAVVVGVPVKDTLKEVTGNPLPVTRDRLTVAHTVDRERIWAAQTPQVFKKDIILRAYEKAGKKDGVTDDAMLVERMGVEVRMVMGSYRNIKINTPADLLLAQGIAQEGEK